jgi:radical SAM/Cys-rich protein
VSLVSIHHPLASTAEQLRVLGSTPRDFKAALDSAGLLPLRPTGIEVLQVNVGKLCNQSCKHCHVDAGPDRREMMSRDTAEACIRVLLESGIPKIDITGGAPELNPNFRWMVEQARAAGRHVIDRCNLTVLTLAPQGDLAAFLAEHRVEVIASLPYWAEQQTDAQRGSGVFAKSIEGIRRLNDLGYGQPGSGLTLNFVYNPVGAYLPPSQAAIEADFRRELRRRHSVVFNHLYTITNMPISRYLEFLLRSGNYERYMDRLANAFNPAAAAAVMCRSLVSVGWDGRLYDCDFNQMLDLPIAIAGRTANVRDFDATALERRSVLVGTHCFGCTAGSGSSCGGATA